MKLKNIIEHLPITKYWIGLVLLAISCGETKSLYPLLAFWGGMIFLVFISMVEQLFY